MRQTGLPFDTHGLARQISQVLSLAGLSMTPRDAQLIDRGLPFQYPERKWPMAADQIESVAIESIQIRADAAGTKCQ